MRRRRRDGLALARAVGLSKENVDNFFDEVYIPLLRKFNLWEKPWCIWNLDETAFQASRANEKVYVNVKSRKNAYSVEATKTKGCFTVLFCGNAVDYCGRECINFTDKKSD